MRASMLCNPPNAASDFFFEEGEISNASLLFRSLNQYCKLFHGFGSLLGMAAYFVVAPFPDSETTKCDRRDKPRHLPCEQFSVAGRQHKTPRICSEKHKRAPEMACMCREICCFFIAVGNACWFARPVRANRRSKARLGSPDRAPQKLSMCIEKPRRAHAY